MKMIGYARVSTSGQTLDAQLEQLEEPGSTFIGFSLEDFELGRQHMAELDRQIVETLTGQEVESSDMDL